jgi:hypothetical protein
MSETGRGQRANAAVPANWTIHWYRPDDYVMSDNSMVPKVDSPMESKQPGRIHLRVVETLKRFPEGISECQIRRELERQGVPAHALSDLHDRIQELDDWFTIERLSGGEAPAVEEECSRQADASVEPLLRATVLHRARGRCGRCRRSIRRHGITLLVRRNDSRHIRETRDARDFWAICEDCFSLLSDLRHRPCYGSRPKCRGRQAHC